MIEYILLGLVVVTIFLTSYAAHQWKKIALETQELSQKILKRLQQAAVELEVLQTENLKLLKEKLELLQRVKALLSDHEESENQKVH